MPALPHRPRATPLGGPSARLFQALLPHAERDEALADLAAEYRARLDGDGRMRAQMWLWRQTLGSVPALLHRTWWRGWNGFEPRASDMQPGGPVIESWIVDLRYSARRLASRPAYAALAILTLALGAGGTAAIFSVARTLLIEPLPIARESQVGVFWYDGSWTEEEFLHFRPRFPGFQSVAAYHPLDATLEIPGAPMRQVPALRTSAEIFEVLGATPLLGRTFRAGEDLPGPEAFAVISYGLWQELGGDQNIVGSRLKLSGVDRTVVGVMPRGFWFPNPNVRVWMTRQLSPQRRSGVYTLIGRVEDGRRIDAMSDPLKALGLALGARFKYPPQWDKTKAPSVRPVREFLVGDVRPSVVATLTAMALILLMACVNVAALMLGQISGRASELAIRASLGAGRRRLMQQLAIESLLIGLIAGAAGALLAAAGFGLIVRALPLGELANAAELNWTLFSAAIGVAMLAAASIAIVPSVALWRSDLRGSMATTRTGGISGRGGRLEGSLLVAQIALAVVLAVGAALLIRSVANLRRVDPGVDIQSVAVLDAALSAQLDSDARKRAILGAIPTLQAVPGVRIVAASHKLPLTGSGDNWGIRVRGRENEESTTTAFRMVTHDYFDVLGVDVRRGRGFDTGDRADTEAVVVINEALASKYFPGEDPINRQIYSGFDNSLARVVGVVENIAEADLTDGPVPTRYQLIDQNPNIWSQVVFVIRAATPADVPAVLQASRTALSREATQLAVGRTATMRSVFDLAVGPAGQLVTLLSLLASLALALGAVGVYGMISHFVARRTRDYGIYLALGLRPWEVLAQIVRRGTALVAVGSAIGVAVSLMLTGLLSSLLYGIGAADPTSLIGAVATLLAVGTAAAVIPAWRASRTDPAVVLRQQ